eukprot:805141-Prymnesium_polylepis.3
MLDPERRPRWDTRACRDCQLHHPCHVAPEVEDVHPARGIVGLRCPHGQRREALHHPQWRCQTRP